MPLCIPPPFHIKEHQNSSLCSATDIYDLIFFFLQQFLGVPNRNVLSRYVLCFFMLCQKCNNLYGD